jgi:lysophospholipase L1-like esterase
MNFRTVLNSKEIQKPVKQIDYQSKIGLIGSCFVENIGTKLSYYKLANWINPYGILFNPLAIEKALTDIYQKNVYTQSDLVFENERWHSLHHHSDFSNSDATYVLTTINKRIEETFQELQTTSHLVLTLGTAWVYHYIERDELVANCHKIPQKNFIKRILSVDEIRKSLENTIELVKKINPEIQVILTLSPVRHIKDGMLANSQSKAQLLAAVYQVLSDDILYFPSYELQLDDLRDYRFYADDMLHPNNTAVDYIWEVFKNIWINPDSYPVMEKVEKVQKAMQHKAFNPDSKQHQDFIENIKHQKEVLYKLYQIQF